jgi:hypothetical protein
MKSIVLLLSFFLMFSDEQQVVDARTQYFPKQELKANPIPDRNHVWVFIMAGQSNMAGRGVVEPMDTLPDNRILSINKAGEIIIAKEPLHFYEPARTGLDCGLSFGKTLIKQVPVHVTVLILPTAVGGSSVSQWLGDSTYRDVQLLTNFKEKVAIGKGYGQVKGILWHQGESDANKMDIPLYKNKLTQLFTTFRGIVGDQQLPIFIGELGSYSGKDDWLKINEVIHLYSSSDRNSRVIKTSDLKHKGDTVHFNAEGQRIIGQRFATEYLKLKKEK